MPLPTFLEPPAESGEAETPAMREKRLHYQQIIYDDYLELRKEHRKRLLEMDKDFETAINIILGSVDQTIYLALLETLASLQQATAEVRYEGVRHKLEISFGPQARDVLVLMDQLAGLSIDQLTLKIFLLEFDQIVSTLERIVLRDLDGRPIRGPLPPLPDEEPPDLDNGATVKQCKAYIRKMRREWTDRSARYPSGGPIRTYKPDLRQLRAYLMTAMSNSRIAKVQQYYNSLLLPENALKSYDEIYKALKAIGEDCAKDAAAKNLLQGREAGSQKATNSVAEKKSQSNPTVGGPLTRGGTPLKCKNCGGPHYATVCTSRRCFACQPARMFDTFADRRRHYQAVHGKSRKDSTRSDEGRSRGSSRIHGDRTGGADHRTDRKRDRYSPGERSTGRESPPAPHEPLGDRMPRSFPKPPNKDSANSSAEAGVAVSGYSSNDDESSEPNHLPRKRNRGARNVYMVKRVHSEAHQTSEFTGIPK